MEKSEDAFRTISEAAGELEVPQHVLRFWESRFSQIRPMKRAGGRRYYRPADMALLRAIRSLLYDEGYTIKGVQRLMREQGVKAITSGAIDRGASAPAAAGPESSEAPLSASMPGRAAGNSNDDGMLRAALAELAAAKRILTAARER